MAEREEAPAPVPEGPRSLAEILEAAIGSIGTTLDEAVTRRELTAFLARHPGGTAVVTLTPDTDRPAAPDTAGPGPVGLAPTVPGSAGLDLAVPDTAGPGPAGRPPAVAGDPVAGEPLVHTLGAPLAVERERPLGAVTLSRSGHPYTEDDRVVLEQAARLAARHIRHARRLAATESVALHLQRALVAEPGRPHPNLEIAGRYLPAGPRTLVGGDWFETVRLHFGRTLLVVGDVMGHGLDAAVDMNAYRSALREVASTDLPPHRVLRHLDAAVAEDGARRPATCLLVRVDPGRGTATFASAGHLPPAVFGPDGSADLVELPVGPPLGTGVGGYEPATRPLGAGDTLLLFTDGLVERRGEDIDVSLGRLAGLRLPPDPGPEGVVEEVLRRLDARHAEDDVAVLAARVRAHPAGRAGGGDAALPGPHPPW
ncbi:PP2C family protein-serine/threonine phosphatase [Streptomyces roseolus]|uniref:PP2C family protein-serine/threonine phosphatase n=1 Tax=Streptomyces roseolus TaxID=67358 RepID=UPI0036E1EF17